MHSFHDMFFGGCWLVFVGMALILTLALLAAKIALIIAIIQTFTTGDIPAWVPEVKF